MKTTYMTNYQEKLDVLKGYMKEGSSRSCVDVLRSQMEEAKTQLSKKTDNSGEDLGEVLIRTLSKDLSRYSDSFERYLKTLEEMNTDHLKYLRKKIITGDKNFFKETWGEDSDNFFRTRKFISTNLKDLSLISKINSSLDCMVISLYRYTYKKYGE